MKFIPISQEEMDSYSPTLEDGVHDFEVIDAKDMVSKNDEEMIELTLKVWNHLGIPFTVRDWMTANPKFQFKIKQFSESVGKPEIFQSGELIAYQLVGLCGKLKTKLKKGIDGVRMFPNVTGYVNSKENNHKIESVKDEQAFIEDDIKF